MRALSPNKIHHTLSALNYPKFRLLFDVQNDVRGHVRNMHEDLSVPLTPNLPSNNDGGGNLAGEGMVQDNCRPARFLLVKVHPNGHRAMMQANPRENRALDLNGLTIVEKKVNISLWECQHRVQVPIVRPSSGRQSIRDFG